MLGARCSVLGAGLVDALTLHLATVVRGSGAPLLSGSVPRPLVQRRATVTSTVAHPTHCDAR
ncbi:hypothetical protein ACFVFH_34925 [Streptomyces sp. NPDC057697]|uniref:hypothetical protein n=1 Tax=Streptomyces sp. NPDC057697 TaxID=3346219 RepID=UPI00369552C7